MTARTALSALAVAMLCGATLSGCLTPNIRPPPSKAVAQARAHAGAKAEGCKPGGLETLSPMEIDFAYDDPKVTEVGQKELARAAQWLGCNAGVEVVILPDADHHGDAAHLDALAQQRGQAVVEALRALGATGPVIHTLKRGGTDPVTAPHLVINARGRGW
jgi:outer membrane protein OmpA-like peptidoglycan-associated protein